MSFTCNQHGWSHLLNSCPYCFTSSLSGDATDTSKITFSKEQAIDLAIETWKAREVCWNTEREQLRSKLSAAEKELAGLRDLKDINDTLEARIDSLKSKFAVAVDILELIESHAHTAIINSEEEWGMSASWVSRRCTEALKAINGTK